VVDLKEKQTTNLKLVVTFLFHHNQKQIIFASGYNGGKSTTVVDSKLQRVNYGG